MVALIASIVTAIGAGSLFGVGSQYSLLMSVVNSLVMWSDGGDVQLVSAIYRSLAPLAYGLALAYAIMEIIEVMQRQSLSNVTPDILILPLVKFAACLLVIQYAPNLMSMLLGSSNSFVQQVRTTIGGFGADGGFSIADGGLFNDSNAYQTQGMGEVSGFLAKVFIQLLPSMISLIGQVIACIIIAVQMVTIRIEILLRYAFMPFAFANIAHGGPNSSGMRYVKRFIGNFVIMGAMLLVIRLSYLVCASFSASTLTMTNGSATVGQTIISSLFGFLVTSLLGPFAAVGAVVAVKATLNEAFG